MVEWFGQVPSYLAHLLGTSLSTLLCLQWLVTDSAMVQVAARNGNINDSVLRVKALDFASKLEIRDFQCSNGWLSNFKKRHGIRMVTPHGESGAADAAGSSLARTVVPVAIEVLGYDMEDVFNFDETALFFRARPSKTLATGVLFKAAFLKNSRV